MNGSSRAALFVVPLAAVALVLSSALTAPATDGNLPGGTPISVNITAPASGTGTPVPPGEVILRGTATVDVGVPTPTILLVYVLDVSTSTEAPCGENPDARVLDCEIDIAVALNGEAVKRKRVGLVGAVAFSATGIAGDLGPADGVQVFTGPGTDADGHEGPDVEQVLKSAFTNEIIEGYFQGGFRRFTFRNVVAVSTNFAAALSKAAEIVSATPASSGIKTRIIVFLSDGAANDGSLASVKDLLPSDVVIKGFAVGGASCDRDPLGRGSLDTVAALGARPGQDSVCRRVASAADVSGVVFPAIFDGTKLDKLLLSVDGQPNVDISGDALPLLPRSGPASITFERTVRLGLASGRHELCVSAEGSDVGGTGVARDCLVLGTLQVAKAGEGEGTVTITSAGGASDTCDTSCSGLSRLYPVGSVLKLRATAAGGSIFTGWNRSDCPGVLDCDLTVPDSTTTVTAVFRRQFSLTVTKGEGSRVGTVVSDPEGIACGPGCPSAVARFAVGSQVMLTAMPSLDATFAGWTPPTCAGDGSCVIVLTGDTNVGAFFGTPEEAFVARFYQNVLEVTPFSPAIDPVIPFLRAYPTPETARALRDAFLALDRRFQLEGRLRTLTPAGYVAAFYRAVLGREPDRDQRAAAIGELFRPVVQIFVDSPELKQRTREDIVKSLYGAFLGRPPGPDDGALATRGDFVGEALQILGSVDFLANQPTLSILDHVSELFYLGLLGRKRGVADPSPIQWEQTLLGLKKTIEEGLVQITDAELQNRFHSLFPAAP